jgi:subtilase family serine protease
MILNLLAIQNPNEDIFSIQPLERYCSTNLSANTKNIPRFNRNEMNTINKVYASPDRLNLLDKYIQLAAENGCNDKIA